MDTKLSTSLYGLHRDFRASSNKFHLEHEITNYLNFNNQCSTSSNIV